MPFFLYASFPNSRLKTRNPTTQEFTPIVLCPAGAVTLVLAADPNRTFVTIQNLDGGQKCYYGFSNDLDGVTKGELINPMASANSIPTIEDVYVFNPGGSDINVGLDFGVG